MVAILAGLCRVLGRALGLEKPHCGLESGPGALKTEQPDSLCEGSHALGFIPKSGLGLGFPSAVSQPGHFLNWVLKSYWPLSFLILWCSGPSLASYKFYFLPFWPIRFPVVLSHRAFP